MMMRYLNVRRSTFGPVLLLALLVGLLAWALGDTFAVQAAPHGAPVPVERIAQTQSATATPTPTLGAPIGLISPTTSITVTATLTPAATIQADTPAVPGLQPTPTPEAETDDARDAGEDDEVEAANTAAPEGTPLEGTIVSNHSGQRARFFIEGQTVELGNDRATSFELPRGTTVLNLYNCAASTPESNRDCFWDPYVLQRDGFFEIYQSRSARAGTVARLMLRAVDAPPTDQVWVQNRSANEESIVYRGEVVAVPPAAVQEFAVDPGLPAILYVRSCISLQGQSACEWAPRTLEPGIYYALTEVQVAAAQPESAFINIDLRPVVGGPDTEIPDASAATVSNGDNTGDDPDGSGAGATASDVVCRVLVPALNIRSGPGLQYEIIGKIFSSEADPGDVRIVGRNTDAQWLVVDPIIMPDGWVTGSDSFITCEGNVNSLALVDAPPLPVAPEPAPSVVVAPEEDTASGEADTDNTGDSEEADGNEADGNEAQQPADAPAGLALLRISNSFGHEVRFTIDQQYRAETGPSEIDLQPGQSSDVVVFPGNITFSVSSPWAGGLSDNAEIVVEADSVRPLWIQFVAESAGAPPSEWSLIWE